MKGLSDICPVCGRQKITPDHERCPQCDADLTCFRVLDSLPDQLPKASPDLPSSDPATHHGVDQTSAAAEAPCPPLPYPAHRVLPGGCRRVDILAVGGLIALVLGLLLGPLCLRFGDFATEMEGQGRALLATLQGLTLTLDRLAADRPSPAGRADGGGTMPSPPSPPPPTIKPETVTSPVALAAPASTPAMTPAMVPPEVGGTEPGPVAPTPSKTAAPAPPQKTAAAKAPPVVRPPAISTARPPSKHAPGQAEFLLYHTQDWDTLWAIAAKFYGSGRYYPVILQHNPGLRVARIRGGLKIRLLKEPAQAQALYAQIVKREGKR